MTDQPRIEDEHGGITSILLGEPEIAVERARFIGAFPYVPPEGELSEDKKTTRYGERENAIEDLALLYMLVGARHIREAEFLQDWSEFTSGYPKTSLKSDEADQNGNPNAAVRAHYIYEAIARLLELVDAPVVLRNDFQILIKRQRPRTADGRAEAQKNILQSPDAGLREIARQSGYDAGELSKDLKKRYILWPGINVA